MRSLSRPLADLLSACSERTAALVPRAHAEGPLLSLLPAARPGRPGALLAAYSLAYALLFVGSRYPFEYLEGVLVDAARRILDGTPLYCDISKVPCVLLPHPPVYVGVVAALGKVLGLSLGLGRLVSFASLLATLGLLYRLARQQVSARAALLAPALYLVFVEVGYFSALMRPEPLALCLELAALLVLLGPPSTRRGAWPARCSSCWRSSPSPTSSRAPSR